MSLYQKHILSVASVMLLVFGFFSWSLYESSRGQIYSAGEQRVELITEIIKNGLKAIMLEGRGEKEFQSFLDIVIAEDIKAVRIFSENGTVFNSTIPGEIGKKIDEKYMHMYRSHANTSVSAYENDGTRIYSSIFVIKNDWPCQQCHGGWEKIRGILGIEVSTDKVGKSLVQTKKMLAGAFVLAGALFVFVIVLTGRHFIKKPLDTLLSALKNIAADVPAPTVLLDGKDEIRDLSAGINILAAELCRCRDEIQQFSKFRDSHMEKMASLGEVAATVAHEIKNPLAGISGALQVLAEDIPDESPRKEICSEILNEIERLDNAVKDMLLFAKTPEPHLILTDINAIIEKARSVIEMSIRRPDVEIRTVLGDVPEVVADPDQMEMVFMNMFRNSLYLMPGSGVITVRSLHRKEGGEIEIAFSDTGKGIPDETLKDVFKPFFSTKQLGTGLKMAISRNIVENHRGRIEVINRLGSGSTFSIIIPDKG